MPPEPRKGPDRSSLTMDPDDASAPGLTSGDRVRVESWAGAVEVRGEASGARRLRDRPDAPSDAERRHDRAGDGRAADPAGAARVIAGASPRVACGRLWPLRQGGRPR